MDARRSVWSNLSETSTFPASPTRVPCLLDAPVLVRACVSRERRFPALLFFGILNGRGGEMGMLRGEELPSCAGGSGVCRQREI